MGNSSEIYTLIHRFPSGSLVRSHVFDEGAHRVISLKFSFLHHSLSHRFRTGRDTLLIEYRSVCPLRRRFTVGRPRVLMIKRNSAMRTVGINTVVRLPLVFIDYPLFMYSTQSLLIAIDAGH